MLTEICEHLKNWFVVPDGIHKGTYTISNGTIALPFLQDGQYFRIIGSVFNDGVHQYPSATMSDEVFNGAVWALAIPGNVIAIAEEISSYAANNAAAAYVSESFGGYSYQKATDESGAAISWQGAYRSRLNKWRKI